MDSTKWIVIVLSFVCGLYWAQKRFIPEAQNIPRKVFQLR